ncbi:mechanosensitive ion channel family protein [Paraglaciecola arctica]|uniref:mechanosensitive ion channel family protein n=1 Tax=Paraglaciecola arctica TaxID=1128911 RepID=UPI001C064CBC|nr:mechanosensitive ion channel domain-containing protein [Paraglaciecola arctica]MBU3001977.1 mechanosensitive ion channel family protein [Paraglaciecola arctica]
MANNWFLFGLLILLFLITRKWLASAFRRITKNKNATLKRKLMVRQILLMSHLVAFIIIGSMVLGIDYGKFIVFLSSAFAVLGIALFAQWSILSNITAGILIFFNFPYRVGDTVRIANKDFDLSGMIEEITTFHVLIRHADGNLITYPNSLILQTPVIKLKSNHVKPPEEEEHNE